MSCHIYCINDTNRNHLDRPHDSNRIYHSILKGWYTGNAVRSLSIKYVLKNSLTYRIGGRDHIVRAGEYLLACKQPGVEAYCENRNGFEAICVDISEKTLEEVFACRQYHDQDPGQYSGLSARLPQFLETVEAVHNGVLGKRLTALSDVLKTQAVPQLPDEWFFQVTEAIVDSQFHTITALKKVKAAKLSTRKEILRRLFTAKEFMNDNFLHIRHNSEVATVANLSEYHFYRSFREVFGLTPHQYLSEKRMAYARSLILQDQSTMAMVASHCSFPDLVSFSKAFKKKYGLPPSEFRRRNLLRLLHAC